MKTNLIAELQWRGMIQDVMPGTKEQLLKEMTTGYVGFDPTSDSLHVGSLLPIMLLVHLQNAGHRPIALVGGATGMVGDPSGKSAERNLLDEEALNKNVLGVSNQLKKFLNFESGENQAILLNNYDWMKNFSFLDFIRDIGKHITVNYMMAKDSVKKRIETGISFTEFSYQLLQGYDYLYLHQNYNCKIQIGGSDQWGNITTGTELIRRKGGHDAFAFTCPLLTKSDGGKFGKTESGTIWLDPTKTTPYAFYQFWLNATDEDAKKLVRYFTLLSKEAIEQLEAEHNEAPHLRILQKAIAEDVTTRVHGKEALDAAIVASNILFGKSTSEDLRKLNNDQFLEVFDGVPKAIISRTDFEQGITMLDALVGKSSFLPSNGEAKRELKANAITINKEKVSESYSLDNKDLINNKFILIGKGKKTNYLLVIE
ncbi:MAG: tyrosine--tRNA ligase [Crocinitomicaceae bacterium]|nr:tyrosine--tRNA ligase [Crocinitomicaceae bacterium]